MAKQTQKLTGRAFDALDEADKKKIIAELEARPVGEAWRKGKPMTAADRKRFAPIREKMAKAGRPKVGRGSKVVAVSVEAGLLDQADDYARAHGIGRTEMFVRGLRLLMGAA